MADLLTDHMIESAKSIVSKNNTNVWLFKWNIIPANVNMQISVNEGHL